MAQFACVQLGGGWSVLSQDEFLNANGATDKATRLWIGLPYVPKPLIDFPELNASLDKVREYVAHERPVREKIAIYKKQGVIADEVELLGHVAETYARIVSMHLANAVQLFEARRYRFNRA